MKLTSIVLFIASSTGAFAHILWDASIKGILLLIVVLAAVLAVRGISASLRHMVLVVAVLSLVFIPLLSWMLPAWQVLPLPTSPPTQMAFDGTIAAAPMAPAAPIPFDGVLRAPQVQPPFVDTAASIAAPKGIASPLPWAAPHLFLALWVTGSLLLIMRLVRSRLRLCEIEDTAARVRDGALVEAVERSKKRLELRRPVEILLGGADSMPMTWGLHRAQLLLPKSSESWSRSQLDSVILHELAHVKRRDVVTQLVVQLVSAIFWYNPLVWLAAWRIRIDRERACDDLVLGAGVAPPDYAENLLGVMTGCDIRSGVRSAAIAMADKARIEGRLESILDDRLNRNPVTKSATILAAAALALTAMPLAMLQADDEGDKDKPSDASTPGEVDAAAEVSPIGSVESATDASAGNAGDATENTSISDENVEVERIALYGAASQSFKFTKARQGDVLRFLFDQARIPYILPESILNDESLLNLNLKGSPFAVLEKVAHSNSYRLVKIDDVWTLKPNQRTIGVENAKKTTSLEPSDIYLQGYLLLEKAALAERQGKYDAAVAKYHSAAKLIENVEKTYPNWNPQIVRYRVKKLRSDLARVRAVTRRYPGTSSAPDLQSSRFVEDSGNTRSVRSVNKAIINAATNTPYADVVESISTLTASGVD